MDTYLSVWLTSTDTLALEDNPGAREKLQNTIERKYIGPLLLKGTNGIWFNLHTSAVLLWCVNTPKSRELNRAFNKRIEDEAPDFS